jgi:uncharacterized protein YegP (UPF0339 family)
MNAATRSSARPGAWWDHLRERRPTAGSREERIMAGEPEFKILKNADGRYYWHLDAAGNRIVAWSGQNYASKQSCADELYWVKDNASLIMIYDYTGE